MRSTSPAVTKPSRCRRRRAGASSPVSGRWGSAPAEEVREAFGVAVGDRRVTSPKVAVCTFIVASLNGGEVPMVRTSRQLTLAFTKTPSSVARPRTLRPAARASRSNSRRRPPAGVGLRPPVQQCRSRPDRISHPGAALTSGEASGAVTATAKAASRLAAASSSFPHIPMCLRHSVPIGLRMPFVISSRYPDHARSGRVPSHGHLRTWTVAVVDLGIGLATGSAPSLVTRCPSGTLVAGLQARPAARPSICVPP